MSPSSAFVLRCADWATLQADARRVRTAVFIEEQGIPEWEEWDEDDAGALHAVVSDEAGQPLATGRLITAGLPLGEGKIGRMAVLLDRRHLGLGRQVLQCLLGAARQQGLHRLTLNAQTRAQAFYARAGFASQGAVFDEVGIPHIAMVLTL